MAENNTTLCSSDRPAIVDKLGTEEQQRGLVGFMRHSLNVFMCDTWSSQENIEKDEIIHHFVGLQVHEFSNIKDTSSPDAPIYKILQAAGVIEIPTELTPIAP